jgi:hypothetical protein
MKPFFMIDGSVPGILGVTEIAGSWGTSGATGVVNNSANGTLAMVAASSVINSSPMTVESTFAIQDGAGLFTNTNSLNFTTGVKFEISYVGSDTLLTLKLAGTTPSVLGPGVASVTEIPCPFARGSVQTIKMSPGQYGWVVHYKSGATWLKLMDLNFSTPFQYSQLLNSMTGNNRYAGVFATKTGVIFDLIKMYRVGLVYNNGPGPRVLFSDHFVGPESATQYNTANASTPGDTELVTPYGAITGAQTIYSSYLTCTGAAPGYSIVTSNRSAPKGLVSADHPFQMICLDYNGGGGAIKLTIGGAMKNIYFNSDIAALGVKAITIESGAA